MTIDELRDTLKKYKWQEENIANFDEFYQFKYSKGNKIIVVSENGYFRFIPIIRGRRVDWKGFGTLIEYCLLEKSALFVDFSFVNQDIKKIRL